MKEKVNNILGKIKEILKKIFDRKWKIVVFIVFILLIIGGILIYQTKWVRDMNAFVNMLEDKDYNCKGEKIGNPFFIDDYRCVLKEDGIKKTVTISENTSQGIYVNFTIKDKSDRYLYSHYDTLIDHRVTLYNDDYDYEQVCMFEFDYELLDVYYVNSTYDCPFREEDVREYYDEFLDFYKDSNLESYYE